MPLPRVLDDRGSRDLRASGGGAWRVFTDAVMGGVSVAGAEAGTVRGRPALCLRGRVSTARNGGFVQMALDLPAPLPEDAAGLEIDVCGRPLRYGLHLRTGAMTAPWQAWRASFDLAPAWQTLRLPFADFEPYRVTGRLAPGDVRRIGLLAIGADGDAELCLGRLAAY